MDEPASSTLLAHALTSLSKILFSNYKKIFANYLINETGNHYLTHSKDELEVLLSEADAADKGDILRQTWKQDVVDGFNFNKD